MSDMSSIEELADGMLDQREKSSTCGKAQSSSCHRPGRASSFNQCLAWIVLLVFGCFTFGHSSLIRRLSFLQALLGMQADNHTNDYSLQAADTLALEVFQVYPPVLTVHDGILVVTDGSSNASIAIVDEQRSSCQETIVSYSFANSYGTPFVDEYSPPLCSFNRITWNLTVSAAGRQFDRLAIVYLGDVEVFRTSTAEPTNNGVQWTYLKDMTPYISIFRQQQTLIFDLGNIVNEIYTAPFDVILTAVFFSADDAVEPADLIIPISSRSSSSGRPSVFALPPDTASNNITLPRNVESAVVTLSATGQISEEFWWSNVPSSTIDTFPETGTLLGYSPFREVQLFIDGSLAGVAWPFPVVFTGGVVPGLWRPIVGIDAFDLKEDEIDITPWLPLLCDGKPHTFAIRVAGLDDDGQGTAVLAEVVGNYWLVTGKIFLWLDTDDHITTGERLNIEAPEPTLNVSSSTTRNDDGSNRTLSYEVAAQRSLAYSALINTSKGQRFAFWQQTRSFNNSGRLSSQGNAEKSEQHTSGYDVSSSGYAKQFVYPLYAESVYAVDAENYSITAEVRQSKDVSTIGKLVFPTGLETFSASSALLHQGFQGASLQTTQNGTATYLANTTSKTSFSFGRTTQDMVFSGVHIDSAVALDSFPALSSIKEIFTRQAEAVNGTVIHDRETLVNETIGHYHGAGTDGHGLLLSGRPQSSRDEMDALTWIL